MSDSKLSQWLASSGLSGRKKSPPQPPLSSGNKKQANNSRSPDKRSSFRDQRRSPRNKTGLHPEWGSKYDPFWDRPSVAKREKYHPTNYLKHSAKTGDIRVVPLGGMQEVGQNMLMIEWGDDIIILDTGVLFAGRGSCGVDIKTPDPKYLVANKHRIRGIIYTHGHLDHIGGAPYLLPLLGFPTVCATRLTEAFIRSQCSEFPNMDQRLKITQITPKSQVKLGKFVVEFFHINHSIPDGVGIVVKTPYGSIVHSSDFKFDYAPSDEQPTDLGRIAQIGQQGVAVAMVDSTNAMRSGHTVSEASICVMLEKLLKEAKGRVIVATFASNVGRVMQMINSAEKCGRTVFLSGRSMERSIAIARQLNFIKSSEKQIQQLSPKVNKMDPSKVLILTTGSQGEELAGLTRMAKGEHRQVVLTKEDTVIFSSSPIPGNEEAINSLLSNLVLKGIYHIDSKQMETHVSGHGHADECKLMTSLLNPKYVAPIHGEVFMRQAHREMIVRDLGYSPANTFLMLNGQGIILNHGGARMMTEKESITGEKLLWQRHRQISPLAHEQRKALSQYGLVLINITIKNGKIAKIHSKGIGFCITEPNHQIWGEVEKSIRATWDNTYDPARPNKVTIAPLQQSVAKIILQHLDQEVIVEVLLQE